MRQKVAKALHREARKFAERTGRTTDLVTTIKRQRKRPIQVRLPEMRPDGTFVVVEIRFGFQDVVTDGPRFFYRQLKKAHRRGLLTRTAAA